MIMRKLSLTVPLAAALMGICLFILRRIQLNTVFDPETGLADEYAPVSLALIALCILVMLLAVIVMFVLIRRTSAHTLYEKAFSISSVPVLALYVIVGVLMAVNAVIFWIYTIRSVSALPIVETVFSLFALLSGVSVVHLAVCSFKGIHRNSTGILSVIPPVFFCLWLVITYKENATNPVLLDYFYECLAMAAAALSFYYAAGFVFGRGRPGMTVLTHLCAVSFMITALAGVSSTAILVLRASAASALLLNSIVFISNLKPKD